MRLPETEAPSTWGRPATARMTWFDRILYGLSAYDMSFFPDNTVQFNDAGALYLNGDTGISAGLEDSLEQIIGDIRAIPIFIEVTGEGNNATYHDCEVCRRSCHGRATQPAVRTGVT